MRRRQRIAAIPEGEDSDNADAVDADQFRQALERERRLHAEQDADYRSSAFKDAQARIVRDWGADDSVNTTASCRRSVRVIAEVADVAETDRIVLELRGDTPVLELRALFGHYVVQSMHDALTGARAEILWNSETDIHDPARRSSTLEMLAKHSRTPLVAAASISERNASQRQRRKRRVRRRRMTTFVIEGEDVVVESEYSDLTSESD